LCGGDLSRRFLSPMEAGIAVGMLALSLGLFYLHASNPLAEPASSFSAAIGSASRASLDDFRQTVTDTYYQNFVGRFGEARFRSVRTVYDEAYALAKQAWLQYRSKAELLSGSAHSELLNKLERLVKEAMNNL